MRKKIFKIALSSLLILSAILLFALKIIPNETLLITACAVLAYSGSVIILKPRLRNLVLKITRRFFIFLFSLVLLLWLLLQTEMVQNYLVKKATASLSEKLHTQVSIGHVSFSFFDKMNMEQMLIRDKQKDTLLYAGALKVRITDWFFLKDTAVLSYIGLENAIIKLQRSDSVWNYQFIADYFSSPKTKDTSRGLQFNLKQVDLKNVSIVQNDRWRGQRLTMKFTGLLLDANSIDFNKGIIDANEIDIDKPYFSIHNFDELDKNIPVKKAAIKDTGMYFNAGNLLAKAAVIKITNGTFINEDDSDKHPNTYFDGSHIKFYKINATFNNVSFIKDTIKAKIEIAATERSGFELKKLTANFKLTPQIMEFAKLDLRTEKSRLEDYYAMKFKDFNHDLNDYVAKIVMDARFKRSVVSSDDIAFFAPELKTWKKEVELTGRFLGTVEDFKLNDLFLRSGSNMYASGTLTMKGLPDIDKTNINFTGGVLQASYADMVSIIPSLKNTTSHNLPALGNVRFAGTFNGSVSDFVVNGSLSTAIGGAYANMHMRFPNNAEPAYTGTITTTQFNLGKFIDADILGPVSFSGKIDGSSFDLDKIKTTLDGSFSSFEFNNYAYSNLTFSGTLSNKYFTGAFKASDPNFDFTSNIIIDLTEDQPKFNLLGDLETANFKQLNFTKDSMQLTGLFDLDFQGKNIDAFTGNAKILNAVLIHDTTRLSFDSLTLHSYFDAANKKILTLQSNQFNATVSGQYSILDLPNSFQAFLSHYYPSYIHPPKTTPLNQDFTIAINTEDFSKYAQVIDERLSGLDNASITGSVDTRDSGSFSFKANIPDLKYQQYKLIDGVVQGKGNFTNLALEGNIKKVYISDSTYFPNTKLSIRSESDHSTVNISTSANNALNDAQLNAEVYTVPDGVRIDFDPSSFVINKKKWDLQKEGELVIRKSLTSAKNVKFSQGSQELTVETQQASDSVNNLVLKLKNIELGDFIPLVTTTPRLQGLATGSVYMRNFYGPFTVDADLKVDKFRLDDDSVGLALVNGNYDSKTGMISYGFSADNPKFNFNAKGTYDTKAPSSQALNTTFHLNGAKIGIVNEFLGAVFSDVKGDAYGDLTLKGDLSAPDLLGNILLRNGSLVVKYTKVHYTIDSALFNFQDGVLDFGEFQIRDDLKNTATVRGKLYEKQFKSMVYDFEMNTNKLLLLNTTAKDNEQFYGRAIGKATLTLSGPQENMQLNITGESNDTSHIFIPTSTSRESADADFIVYKQYGTETKLEKTTDDDNTNITINLDLTATNKTQIDVILDELTGDVIKATGSGNLKIKVPPAGDMTMTGRYDIERGSYDFNFQSFIKKPFELLPDAGNFIEWNGDPYKANIHIDAQYTAQRVSLNDLISNQSADFSGETKGYRGDVYVVAKLTGNLQKPDIGFDLKFPVGSPVYNDYYFTSILAKLEDNNGENNEMLKQVTYLIVLGSFAPYGDYSTGSASATSLTVNTISEKITGELNKLFSNVLFKLTGDKSLRFDVGSSTYSSSSLLDYGGISTNITNNSANKLDRTAVNLKLNQSILNGKVIFTFGGDLDFGLTSAAVQNSNFQWLPDISVQVVLTKDRKLRAIVFNKSSLDVNVASAALGRTTRQGVSLTYTKDFEKIFGNKPKDSTKVKAPVQ